MTLPLGASSVVWKKNVRSSFPRNDVARVPGVEQAAWLAVGHQVLDVDAVGEVAVEQVDDEVASVFGLRGVRCARRVVGHAKDFRIAGLGFADDVQVDDGLHLIVVRALRSGGGERVAAVVETRPVRQPRDAAELDAFDHVGQSCRPSLRRAGATSASPFPRPTGRRRASCRRARATNRRAKSSRHRTACWGRAGCARRLPSRPKRRERSDPGCRRCRCRSSVRLLRAASHNSRSSTTRRAARPKPRATAALRGTGARVRSARRPTPSRRRRPSSPSSDTDRRRSCRSNRPSRFRAAYRDSRSVGLGR